MTLHNLDEQLAWLLRTNPSIPPTDNALPPAADSLSPGRVSQQRQIQSNEQPPPRAQLQARDPNIAADTTDDTAADMARLRTAPSSASKPHLLSMGPRPSADNFPAERPPYAAEQYIPRTMPQAIPSKKTPIIPSRINAPPPDDVEIMDLTGTISPLGSPIPRRIPSAQPGRKRKSEEYELDLAPARTSARPVPTSAAPPSSDGFSSIEDIMDDMNGPPPPYSTVAPRAAHMAGPWSRNTFGARPSHQTDDNGAIETTPNADIDEDDDIVSFTGNRRKRSRIEEESFSTKSALAAKPSVTSDSKSPMRGWPADSPVPEKVPASKLDSKQFFGQFVNHLDQRQADQKMTDRDGPDLENTTQKISSSNTGTQAQEEASEDVALLRRLFAAPETDIQRILNPLDDRDNVLIEEIALRLDESKDADELLEESDNIQLRIGAIRTLSSKRASFMALYNEKDQLMTALKAALRAPGRQGKDRASAANKACKEKITALENECLVALKACQHDVETFFATFPQKQAVKSVAIASTQAPPARPARYEPNVPSSSKVLQTQMSNRNPQPPPMDHRATTGNMETYFSQQQKAKLPKSNHTYDDDFQDLDDEEEFMAANQALFTNKMGTPPDPVNYHDNDDFGIGEDDDGMLEFAQDFEDNGFAEMRSRNQSRSVFSERSPNRADRATKMKPAKPPKNSVDDLEGRLFSFAWSNEVKATLKERFKLRGFRENQLEAINATLGGKDAFVLMPTGGGKSLCYQLPALVRSGKTRGVTIVVSPLLSLMEDQVQHLRNLNIQAFLINSETDAAERGAILDALEERNAQDFIQLLYVTPEMLSKSQRIIKAFDSLYRRQQLARLVIDEAHCVSQWGHDFRPDYKLIGDVRKNYPRVPVIALTATATENVKVDVIHNLNIKGCDVFTRSFNRANLYYEVRAKGKAKDDLTSIAKLIKEKHKEQTGIIYCLSRQNCEDFAKMLSGDHGVKAHHYHAGMDSAQKKEVQRKWQAGEYKVIVATIAFGMGIDKANVRFVVHHSVPKSLEGYYQETGRAGRDGKRSSCYLYYGYQDAGKLRRMIDQGEGSWEQKERQNQMLQKMVQYCENRSDCRRVQVLAYFSEAFHRDACEGQCDNCNSSSNFEMHDFTEYARQAVEIVSQIHQNKVTILQCMDVFRGHKSKKVKDAHWDELDQFGAGSDVDREDAERLFYRLLSENAFREVNEMNRAGFATAYVTLGRNSDVFIRGRQKFQLEIRSTPKAKKVLPTKKKTNNDTKELQSKDWKTTVGSRSRAELPLSTNVSSPIQAASKRKTTRQPTPRKRKRLRAGSICCFGTGR